jgi:hypothetical protein
MGIRRRLKYHLVALHRPSYLPCGADPDFLQLTTSCILHTKLIASLCTSGPMKNIVCEEPPRLFSESAREARTEIPLQTRSFVISRLKPR